MTSSEWAAWVGAVATVGALVAATYAGVIAARLYRTERARDLSQQRRALRDQAVLIAGWANASREAEPTKTQWTLRNASTLPVYSVAVGLVCSICAEREYVTATVIEEYTLDLVPPGDTLWTLRPPIHKIWMDHKRRHMTTQDFGVPGIPILKVGMRFTDASGLVWWREIDGVLTAEDPGSFKHVRRLEDRPK